jgi:tetratricopeptide (TPR) repeat protein
MNRAQRRLAERQERQSVGHVFAAALADHQAGRLDAAEHGYRQVLAADPRHADSLHLLGLLAHQRGSHAAAVALIRRAIGSAPDTGLYHGSLGTALQALGELDDAIAAHRRAVALQPGRAELHFNLGNACHAYGALDAAEHSLRTALALRPDYAEAACNLGRVLDDQGRTEDAIAVHRTAVALRPGLAAAHTLLGQALTRAGRPEQAIDSLRAALALTPDDAGVLDALGTALADLGRPDEACTHLRRAVALRPDDAQSHFNLATALLARGNLTAGWPEYEWRWATPQMARECRRFAVPRWRGEPAQGARLLIHAEQGFGDTLQFCRYATLAAAMGLAVILEVQPALVRLLRSLSGPAQVVARGEALPDFDLHCPMLSLPLAFATTLASIPAAVPYLHAEPAKAWAGAHAEGPRVGLAWAGSATLLADRRRSLDPAVLAPLLAVPAVRFCSLQLDGPKLVHPRLADPMATVRDFADTAALVAGLDLVISADTAVAHLAAAMGKPVWLLCRADACWRWLAGRRDSPWYPTLTLYRQATHGDWRAVIAEVAAALRALAPGSG